MFSLRSTLSDGFIVALDGRYATIEQASAAASRYMRDYSDPCGLGVHVAHVVIVDSSLVSGE